jgi:hypothetical protein
LERNEAFLDLDERRLLIRICVSHMCMMTGTENLYPTAATKEELAKAIVEAFPCLAIPVDAFNLKAYTHLYNPKITDGFIDTRLKSMRSAKSSKRKVYDKGEKSTSNNPAAKRKAGNRKPELVANDKNTSTPYIEEEMKFQVIISRRVDLHIM